MDEFITTAIAIVALYVVEKRLVEEEYKYEYKISFVCLDNSLIKQDIIVIRTDTNWNVGDTIHIGARWGKTDSLTKEQETK